MSSGHGGGGIDEVVEDIIDKLQPKKIRDVLKPHKKARRGYSVKDDSVSTYADFTKQIRDYVKHHHQEVFKTKLDDDRALGMAIEAIENTEAYQQRKGGIRTAFKDASEGNLQEVLDAIAASFMGEAQTHYTKAQIHRIDPSDFDTHVKVAAHLQKKYNAFMPKTHKDKKPEELAPSYSQLITHHIEQVAETGQNYGREKKGGGHGHH